MLRLTDGEAERDVPVVAASKGVSAEVEAWAEGEAAHRQFELTMHSPGRATIACVSL